MEKPGENIPIARHKHRWKDNIKKYLQEIGSMGVNRIALAMCDRWRALVNAVMNLRDSLPSSQFPTGLQIKKKN